MEENNTVKNFDRGRNSQPGSLCKRNGRFPILESTRNESGDVVIVTGDNQGSFDVILLRNKNASQQGVDFVKYEIGDFVSKPVTGICKIENILYLNPQDEKMISYII